MDEVIIPTLPTYLFEPNLYGVLSLVLTVVLPLVAALFMKANWSSTVKGLILLAVAAVKTFVEAWVTSADTGVSFDVLGAAYTVVVNYGIAVAMHFGLLRGSTLSQWALSSGPVK